MERAGAGPDAELEREDHAEEEAKKNIAEFDSRMERERWRISNCAFHFADHELSGEIEAKKAKLDNEGTTMEQQAKEFEQSGSAGTSPRREAYAQWAGRLANDYDALLHEVFADPEKNPKKPAAADHEEDGEDGSSSSDGEACLRVAADAQARQRHATANNNVERGCTHGRQRSTLVVVHTRGPGPGSKLGVT